MKCMTNGYSIDEIRRIQKQANATDHAFRAIDGSGSYSQRALASSQDALNEMGAEREALKKSPLELKAKENVAERLYGDKREHLSRSSDELQLGIKEAQKEAARQIALYVERNFDRVFSNFEDGRGSVSLANLVVNQSNLYSTGGENKDHDYVVGSIMDLRHLGKIAEDKDLGKMRGIVEKSMKSKDVPEWGRKVMKYFLNDERFIEATFQKIYSAKAQVVQVALHRKDGKPNVSRLKSLLEESLKIAKEKRDEETDESKIGDIKSDVIDPIYLGVARAVYPIVKAKSDDEDLPYKIKNYLNREAERGKLGMAA